MKIINIGMSGCEAGYVAFCHCLMWRFSEKRGIPMDEISKATRISRQTLSRMINTHGYNATTDNLDKLCEFFDYELKDISVRVAE